ncbi:hypothetical protein CBM2634_A90022 [Cupriavidus taiwanensis]|uniref:Uncharacterized protein n=1 Tax=Cupriavidus taiwanensis TaxID=164546 RepID=A0A375J5T8_9BURK|nr:hypothetical protein CBM2634_A90022 [Cupriavidus taiwanensis]
MSSRLRHPCRKQRFYIPARQLRRLLDRNGPVRAPLTARPERLAADLILEGPARPRNLRQEDREFDGMMEIGMNHFGEFAVCGDDRRNAEANVTTPTSAPSRWVWDRPNGACAAYPWGGEFRPVDGAA